MEEKPTLLQLRRSYNNSTDTPITSQQLAQAARVPLADEFMMELGRPVSAEIANRVINTFSKLAGHRYTLANISVSLKEPSTEQLSNHPVRPERGTTRR